MCYLHGCVGNITLPQQNPPVLNLGCWPKQIDCIMAVIISNTGSDSSSSSITSRSKSLMAHRRVYCVRLFTLRR